MAGLLADDKDIRFVLFDMLETQDLLEKERFRVWSVKAFRLLLEEAGRLAENRLFPLHLEGDRIGAQFVDGRVFSVPGTKKAYLDFVGGGWLTPCEDESIGGQQLPKILKYATHEIFLAANFPFMCYANLSHDAGKLIELFGTTEQKKTYLQNLYNGEWTGTMAITEPEAGSDVGAIETSATEISAGAYLITGQKIFITNGDHDIAENIIHMVLARIDGDPPGTKGLSLFIVPKYRVDACGEPGQENDMRCIGIEKKMGLHASPTTTLSFGEKNDCHGYLLGEVREGIKIMFHMINSSRLEVGLWGLGIASAAYRHSLQYATARKQGTDLSRPKQKNRAKLIEHPDIRRTLLTMKSQVEGMRALLYFCGYAMDRSENAETKEISMKWRDIVELLIPICKAYPTEKAVEIASQAIQVHGGYGYTRDYPVEMFMRDSKVACIFEGTTGIQAMDFALRKVGMKNHAVFKQLIQHLVQQIQPATDIPELKPYAAQLEKPIQAFDQIPLHFNEEVSKRRLFYPQLKATPFLDAAGDVLIGCFLLWGALVAREKLNLLYTKKKISEPDQRDAFIEKNTEAAFLAGKSDCAKFFIGNLLPVTYGKIEALKWGDVSAWEFRKNSF